MGTRMGKQKGAISRDYRTSLLITLDQHQPVASIKLNIFPQKVWAGSTAETSSCPLWPSLREFDLTEDF